MKRVFVIFNAAAAMTCSLYLFFLLSDFDKRIQDSSKDREQENRASKRVQSQLADLRQTESAVVLERNEPTDPNVKIMLQHVLVLREGVGNSPVGVLPELRFLKPEDWLRATLGRDLTADRGRKDAISELSRRARLNTGPLLRAAVLKYIDSHQGNIPASMEETLPYFKDGKGTTEMMRRYTLETGVNGQLQVTEIEGDGTPSPWRNFVIVR